MADTPLTSNPKLRRYAIGMDCEDGYEPYWSADPCADGEWVKYEDVSEAIEIYEKEHARLTAAALYDEDTLHEAMAEIDRLRLAILRWSQHYWGLRCKCDACEDLRGLVRAADETSRCPAGLKGYTRCKLSMGHSGDCDYEDLL